jgi:hypothetical protein
MLEIALQQVKIIPQMKLGAMAEKSESKDESHHIQSVEGVVGHLV